MDEHYKYAYRTLLYHAMLEIRGQAWHPYRSEWCDPKFWRRFLPRTRYHGEIAEWLHNMAAFSRCDFAGFDESRFWSEFEQLAKRFPEAKFFRDIFEYNLTYSRTGKWPNAEEQHARLVKDHMNEPTRPSS